MMPSIQTQRQRPPAAAPAGQAVTLDRYGQYFQVLPPVAGLEADFFTISHVPVADPELGHRAVPVALPLLWRDRDAFGTERLQGFAGLEPLVQEHLERDGYKVRLSGKRPRPLPPPDEQSLENVDPLDAPMLEFVRRRERGLIRFTAGKVSPAHLVAQIAGAWPDLRVVVVATRIDDARGLRRQLVRWLGAATLFTSRHGAACAGRVAVATYSMLAVATIRIRRRHVYIAVNPSELFHGQEDTAWGIQAIKRLYRARLYGLLADDVRLGPQLRDLVAALFGFDEVRVPRHGYSPLPVRVVFSPIYGGSRAPDHKDDYVVKRVGVYEHHVRNRRIVRLAQALAGSDRAVLKQKFPDVAAVLGRGQRMRVGVVVDGVGHGLALAAALGWPLVAADDVNEAGLSAAQRLTLKNGRSDRRRTREPVVATGAGLARAGRFDVIVRADGGAGLPAVPATKLRVKGVAGERRLLLIDFIDRQHPLLRRWSRQRREAYTAAGWKVAGEEKTPLERFIATRPEGVLS